MVTALAVAVSAASVVTFVASPASAAPELLSQGRPVTASSVENGGTPVQAAVDGNTGTRWSSAAADPQWIAVDLGSAKPINQVVLN
ncbi:discoidin domain-containing protein, partial [Saccharothrix sp. MB29]|nr:discoidin domain-containing protein [Saccharothrix sp. MB29]